MQALKSFVCSYPAAQKHKLGLSLPPTDVELPGHATHDVLEIAPKVVPYVFTPYNVHATEPTVGL